MFRCIIDYFIITVCPVGTEGKVIAPTDPDFPFEDEEPIFSPEGTTVGPTTPVTLTPSPEVCDS